MWWLKSHVRTKELRRNKFLALYFQLSIVSFYRPPADKSTFFYLHFFIILLYIIHSIIVIIQVKLEKGKIKIFQYGPYKEINLRLNQIDFNTINDFFLKLVSRNKFIYFNCPKNCKLF